MKKSIFLLLSGLLCLGSASAQNQPPFSPDAIASARAAAASAAGIGRAAAVQVGQDGALLMGPDGKPLSAANSPETMRGNLRMFQKDVGLEGVEQVSSPSNAARTGRARAAIRQSFTFNCTTVAQSKPTHGAGSLGFRVDACERDGTAVKNAVVSICESAAASGICSGTDFSTSVRLVAGQYSSYKELQLGLGCNTVGSCQVSVSGSYTVGGNDQEMRGQTTQAGSSSNVIAGLREAVTQGDYAGKMTEIGQPLQACAEANRSGTPGEASSCDGSKTVQIQSSRSTGQCSTQERTCVREASTTTNFTRSCVRTFPLTEKITSYQYDKTATCSITSYAGNVKPTENSCTGAPGTSPIPGGTLIGSSEPVCQATDVNPCASSTYTEYWADVGTRQTLGSSETPSAVGGACDTRANSETTFQTCQNGNWFGRTRDAAECRVMYTDEASGSYAGAAEELSYAQVAGCGLCLTPSVGQTCYGVANPTPAQVDAGADVGDSCAVAELAGCRLKTVTDVQMTSTGGLVSSQKEIYECSSEVRQCVQWSSTGSDPSCISQDLAMGTDRIGSQPNVADGSMNAALVAAAMADGTGRGIEVGSSQSVPKLFGGEDSRCKRPTGGIGQLVSKNCCRINLERPKKGNIIQAGCSLDEAKLAAARRSSYATYIGEYCSKSLKFLGARKCLQYTQTYCVFPGILPRLVQEQGRAQLADMLASSPNQAVERAPLTFAYHSQSDGNWTAPVVVNGVRIAAWQWPSYCADPGRAAEILANDPSKKDCPGTVSTWFAACDLATGCGELPAEPTEGSLHWKMKDANPLENLTTAVSRFSAVTGACSTQSQNCSYTASAWPVGVGGRAVATKDITWTLFSQEQQTTANSSPQAFQINNVGDLMFKGFSVPGSIGGSVPSTVRVDFSRDGGQNWTPVQLSTNLRGTEATIPNTDVRVTGFCDSSTNSCEYRVTGTVEVTAHPWGDPKNPDCSGFTAGQLSALDFGRMDLSEWLATVMDKIGASTPQNLASQATAQFQAFNSLFQSGQVRASAPVAANFARAVPAEGFGPFEVKLAVAGYWPEVTGDPARDLDKVLSVTVDWGNCKPAEALTPVAAMEGTGFRGIHAYQTPDAESYPCLKSSLNDTKNIVHTIKLTVNTSRSGQQVKTVSVENAYSRFPGAAGNNSKVTTTRGAATQSTQVPPVPRP